MERAEEGQEQGRVSSFTAGISLSSLNLERPCLKGTCTKSNCRPRSAAKITLRLRGGWLVDNWSIYLIMHIGRDNNNTRSSSCRGSSRGREREGDCEQETKIYNFARHSAYKMSQQTTAGAGGCGRSRGSSRRLLQGCRLRRYIWGRQWRCAEGASSQAPAAAANANADDNQKTDKSSCNDAGRDVHDELVSVSVTCHMCVRCGNDLHRGVA